MSSARIHGEEGHALPAVGSIAAAAGAILLMFGALNDTDGLTIAGGIVLAFGLVATPLLIHVGVDYGIYGRLESLEGRGKDD